MSMKSTKTRLTEWLARVVAPPRPAPEALPHPDSEKLIEQLDVTVIAYCPCGSTRPHRLSLIGTSECLRCSRTLAVRSILYMRSHYGEIPTPQVSVGYVQLAETLRQRETAGVH
jgi:hypothetical protein